MGSILLYGVTANREQARCVSHVSQMYAIILYVEATGSALFPVGEATGNKADPNQVSVDMRAAKEQDGERRFKRDEWLTKTQIQGFFPDLQKPDAKDWHLPWR